MLTSVRWRAEFYSLSKRPIIVIGMRYSSDTDNIDTELHLLRNIPYHTSESFRAYYSKTVGTRWRLGAQSINYWAPRRERRHVRERLLHQTSYLVQHIKRLFRSCADDIDTKISRTDRGESITARTLIHENKGQRNTKVVTAEFGARIHWNLLAIQRWYLFWSHSGAAYLLSYGNDKKSQFSKREKHEPDRDVRQLCHYPPSHTSKWHVIRMSSVYGSGDAHQPEIRRRWDVAHRRKIWMSLKARGYV